MCNFLIFQASGWGGSSKYPSLLFPRAGVRGCEVGVWYKEIFGGSAFGRAHCLFDALLTCCVATGTCLRCLHLWHGELCKWKKGKKTLNDHSTKRNSSSTSMIKIRQVNDKQHGHSRWFGWVGGLGGLGGYPLASALSGVNMALLHWLAFHQREKRSWCQCTWPKPGNQTQKHWAKQY